LCLTQKSMAKRRKRGRPATGHDPILGIRVPAKIIRKIDRLAEVLSIDRSTTVRRLLSEGLASRSWLLRTGKGRGRVGELIAAKAADVRAKGAEAAVARARPEAKLAAEIKAHRAEEEAAEKLLRIGDRIALQSAKASPSHPHQEPPPIRKPTGRARRLGDAEVKAAVDRAMARRKEPDA
jgi:metal-responsive CopG/Arc/MetJ family transcriptional regulator